jgi:uncharacterized membrane protein
MLKSKTLTTIDRILSGLLILILTIYFVTSIFSFSLVFFLAHQLGYEGLAEIMYNFISILFYTSLPTLIIFIIKIIVVFNGSRN